MMMKLKPIVALDTSCRYIAIYKLWTFLKLPQTLVPSPRPSRHSSFFPLCLCELYGKQQRVTSFNSHARCHKTIHIYKLQKHRGKTDCYMRKSTATTHNVHFISHCHIVFIHIYHTSITYIYTSSHLSSSSTTTYNSHPSPPQSHCKHTYTPNQTKEKKLSVLSPDFELSFLTKCRRISIKMGMRLSRVLISMTKANEIAV